jgi:hypothetical protein
VWQLLGLGTQALGLFSEAVGERQDVFETASLHRAAPVADGWRERNWRSHHR